MFGVSRQRSIHNLYIYIYIFKIITIFRIISRALIKSFGRIAFFAWATKAIRVYSIAKMYGGVMGLGRHPPVRPETCRDIVPVRRIISCSCTLLPYERSYCTLREWRESVLRHCKLTIRHGLNFSLL